MSYKPTFVFDWNKVDDEDTHTEAGIYTNVTIKIKSEKRHEDTHALIKALNNTHNFTIEDGIIKAELYEGL